MAKTKGAIVTADGQVFEGDQAVMLIEKSLQLVNTALSAGYDVLAKAERGIANIEIWLAELPLEFESDEEVRRLGLMREEFKKVQEKIGPFLDATAALADRLIKEGVLVKAENVEKTKQAIKDTPKAETPPKGPKKDPNPNLN